jgi:hypothetical protein
VELDKDSVMTLSVRIVVLILPQQKGRRKERRRE